MKRTIPLVLAAATALFGAAGASAQTTLRIGLQEDPDALDPHRARTYVGRIVFSSLCGKLVDTTPDLKFVPGIATSWNWSEDGKTLTFKLRPNLTFHDGEPLDAAAVKANIERAKNLPDSLRKSELASVTSVEVVDPVTVALHVSQPDATLLAQLSDRAGMMLSPKAFENFAQKPVCSGPYKFVERIQNDRIVLEKFKKHWDAASYSFDRVIFLPIPDTTVRLANLRAGDLDMLERLAPSDFKSAKADPALTIESVVGLGYQSLRINVAHGDRARNPLGQDKRVRQALSLAIGRDVINQVVFEGLYPPAIQHFPEGSPYYNEEFPAPKRDVEKARELLKAAGHETVAFELMISTSNISKQVNEVIQAMAAEAGFQISLRPTEFAAMQKEMQAGNFEVAQIGWSGRVDPDGNIHQHVTCKGNLNDLGYCNPEVDKLLNQARTTTDEEKRKEIYAAAQVILQDELPTIHLYYPSRIFAMSSKLKGFVPHPDGMIRLKGMHFEQ